MLPPQIQKIIQTLHNLNSLRQNTARARVAAAVFNKHGILDVGINSYKTHPKQKLLNELKPYLHAEVEAITRARSRVHSLEKFYLVVVRTKKDMGRNVYGDSAPCPSCEYFIRQNDIKNVIYFSEKKGWVFR